MSDLEPGTRVEYISTGASGFLNKQGMVTTTPRDGFDVASLGNVWVEFDEEIGGFHHWQCNLSQLEVLAPPVTFTDLTDVEAYLNG